jgi:hypothetical protein
MHQIIKNFIGWIRGLFDKPYQPLKTGDELPKKLRPKVLYLLGDQDSLWQASFICPCGCKETIHLNLLTDERPCWEVHFFAKNKVTLHPSIWRKVGCKSHFWLQEGHIIWVKE